MGLLCRQAPGRPAPASFSVLARSRTWTTTFARSRASATLRGRFEPQRPTEESNLVRQLRRLPCCQHTRRADVPTGNRTRAWTFGESNAIRYTIGTKSRRLDSHQHEPVYKTGAFLSRATSAKAPVQGVEPCRAALETACSPGSTPVSCRSPSRNQGFSACANCTFLQIGRRNRCPPGSRGHFTKMAIPALNSLTGSRTRASSLGPRCDLRFTIRAKRKARDSNPHSPKGARISNAARPTVSGYLP